MKTEKELFEAIEKLNFSTASTGSKKELYKYPEGMFDKVAKKRHRVKTRNEISRLCSIIAKKNQSFSKTKKISEDSKKELESFLKIYKENFLINNFELSSFREKISDENELNVHLFALLIVKEYISKEVKK